MTGIDYVHQIECRWQPERDFSPIATSLSVSELQEWFTLVKGAVSPQSANSLQGVPGSSLVYLTFPDSHRAAIIWRRYDLNALQINDTGQRRPLVARVLVGEQRQLTPQTALALCQRGISRVAGRPPGMVEPRSSLPPILSLDLMDLVEEAIPLDDQASQESGLSPLVAAALRDHDRPLEVQLPATETCDDSRTTQYHLLLGLWRTTAPLLSDLGDPYARGWTFSTYEPGLDSGEPSVQADMVFRTARPGARPRSVASAVTVLPREAQPAGLDRYTDLADRLVMAYRHLGGKDLSGRLARISAPGTGWDDRMAAVHDMLEKIGIPGPDRTSSLVAKSVRTEDQARPADEDRAYEEIGQFAVSDAGITQPAARVARPGSMTGPAGPNRSATDGATVIRQDRKPIIEHGGMAEALEWLAASKGPDDVERALATLRGPGRGGTVEDRAAARRALPQQQWCVPILTLYDAWHVGQYMQTVIRRIVIPEFGAPAVQAEVAGWAGNHRTPAVVVHALIAAAHEAGHEQAAAMHDLLTVPLHQRWLIEHGIYVQSPARGAGGPPGSSGGYARPPARQAPARPESARPESAKPEPAWSRPRSLLRVVRLRFPVTKRTATIATLLSWLCLGLIVALALSLVL